MRAALTVSTARARRLSVVNFLRFASRQQQPNVTEQAEAQRPRTFRHGGGGSGAVKKAASEAQQPLLRFLSVLRHEDHLRTTAAGAEGASAQSGGGVRCEQAIALIRRARGQQGKAES
jgi:hypothetical protein